MLPILLQSWHLFRRDEVREVLLLTLFGFLDGADHEDASLWKGLYSSYLSLLLRYCSTWRRYIRFIGNELRMNTIDDKQQLRQQQQYMVHKMPKWLPPSLAAAHCACRRRLFIFVDAFFASSEVPKYSRQPNGTAFSFVNDVRHSKTREIAGEEESKTRMTTSVKTSNDHHDDDASPFLGSMVVG